jgi:hypothetical protein
VHTVKSESAVFVKKDGLRWFNYSREKTLCKMRG